MKRGSGLLLAFALSFASSAGVATAHDDAATFPDSPISEFLPSNDGMPDTGFCSQWNPEFGFRGLGCCVAKLGYLPRKQRRLKNRCAPWHVKSSFCDEMTGDQRAYVDAAQRGELGDVLELIRAETGMRRVSGQAYCSVNNGFLAWGRRIVPSAANRIQLRTPQRCVDFGTDPMVGMLEWAGRQVAREYSEAEYKGVRLTIGDLSAPRGGCLPGRGGRRGHASHTSGQDADIGFLTVQESRNSPQSFHKTFDAKANWWLLKTFFSNPFACVKVVFLDHRLIGKLGRVAWNDPLWPELRRHIKHAKFHKNHMHVRVGDGPGQPGCPKDLPASDEDDEDSPDAPGEGDGGLPPPTLAEHPEERIQTSASSSGRKPTGGESSN